MKLAVVGSRTFNNYELLCKYLNTIHVKEVRLYNGASFITVLLGSIVTMPGLPKEPAYEDIKLNDINEIEGIF